MSSSEFIDKRTRVRREIRTLNPDDSGTSGNFIVADRRTHYLTVVFRCIAVKYLKSALRRCAVDPRATTVQYLLPLVVPEYFDFLGVLLIRVF